MTALTLSINPLNMKAIADRAYQTARQDEFKTTITDHPTDEGCWIVQREGQKERHVWTCPLGGDLRCTCGWFKITGVCSHCVSVDFHLDLLRQEAEHEERTEGEAFMRWCKADREAADALAADPGDYLSSPFAE